MESFPNEIKTQVLSVLPVKDVLRCRSVCKSWKELIDDHQFAALHLYREIESSGNRKSTPRFILRPSKYGGIVDWSMYLVEQEKDSPMFKCTKMSLSLPENISSDRVLRIQDVNGLFSVNGLILNSNYTIIFNPFTGQFVKLPRSLSQSPGKGSITQGFGYDQSSKVFKVVQMFKPYYYCSGTKAHALTLGSSSSWRKLENAPTIFCKPNAVAVSGHIHWLQRDNSSILSFDVASEKFRFVPIPTIGCLTDGPACIRKCDDCLSMFVYVGDHVLGWVMKDYGVSESWTKFVFPEANINVHGMIVQPISFWKEGEILLVYGLNTLASYNVESGRYTPLDIIGLPDCVSYYDVFPYCGNLLSL